MQDLPSYRTTIGTLCRFLNDNCHEYIMYMASESQPTTAEDFGDQLYAYLSRHVDSRIRNWVVDKEGDKNLWQLLYNFIEDAPQMVWTSLGVYYLEQFKQSEPPESGNWICPDPLINTAA